MCVSKVKYLQEKRHNMVTVWTNKHFYNLRTLSTRGLNPRWLIRRHQVQTDHLLRAIKASCVALKPPSWLWPPSCWSPCPASLQESLWSPGRNLQDVFQQRRRVLMQRSDRRVQEIKAKRAAARNGPPSRVLVEGRDPGRAAVQTVPRKETTEDRKRAERKLRPPPPGSTPTTLISEHFIPILWLYDVTFYRIIRMFFLSHYYDLLLYDFSY